MFRIGLYVSTCQTSLFPTLASGHYHLRQAGDQPHHRLRGPAGAGAHCQGVQPQSSLQSWVPAGPQDWGLHSQDQGCLHHHILRISCVGTGKGTGGEVQRCMKQYKATQNRANQKKGYKAVQMNTKQYQTIQSSKMQYKALKGYTKHYFQKYKNRRNQYKESSITHHKAGQRDSIGKMSKTQNNKLVQRTKSSTNYYKSVQVITNQQKQYTSVSLYYIINNY